MDSVTIESYQSPVPKMTARVTTVAVRARRPPSKKAMAKIAAAVMNQGESASSSCKGFSRLFVTKSLVHWVMSRKVSTNQSENELTQLARESPQFQSSGNSASLRYCLESHTHTSAMSPPPMSMMRRTWGFSRRRAEASARSPAAVVMRSSMMASRTMQSPATKACPTLRICSALRTGIPSPGPLIRAAMTAIERAAIVVWFSPTKIVRRAMGSCTFRIC